MLRQGTIIHAPTSTKNREDKCDPERHQTKKGNPYDFGMKPYRGADFEPGCGSDSAAIRTTATRDDDHYVLYVGTTTWHSSKRSVLYKAKHKIEKVKAQVCSKVALYSE